MQLTYLSWFPFSSSKNICYIFTYKLEFELIYYGLNKCVS